MSTLHTRVVDRCTISWAEYTDDEIAAAWNNTNGQGNEQARAGGQYCVKVCCKYDQAIKISRMFIRRFAVPSCCYWNPESGVLTMYCGDASRNAPWLMDDIERIIQELKEWGCL